MSRGAAPGVKALLDAPPLPFDLTVVENASPDSEAVVALRRAAKGRTRSCAKTSCSSGRGKIFSLSHVALPFAPDDPVYGAHRPRAPTAVYLGRPDLLGERGLLAVPAADLLRLRFNPFFSYVEARILDFLKVSGGPTAAAN